MYNGIDYHNPQRGAAGETCTCDKVQLVYRLRHGAGQALLDDLSRQLWIELEHWESRRPGTYNQQFRVKCGPMCERSFWFGVGLTTYAKGRPGDDAKLEYNPNKVGGDRALLWLLRKLWSYSKLRDGVRVKQWDYAVDYPHPREWYSLRKDTRLYEEMRHSAADRTQYVGQRNAPGRCKLYNKQVESSLPHPLTRLEVTVDGLASPAAVAAIWPVVYRLADVQTDAAVAALSDTDRFIFATLLREPDRLGELGRRKRQRFAALLERCNYRVAFDVAAYARVLADVARLEMQPDDRDGDGSPKWVRYGDNYDDAPGLCWPD